MKVSLCVTALAIAIMLSSSAAYADPQTGATAPNAAATSGSASDTGHSRHGPCHDDVQKFCGNVPKGNGKVLDCLKEHVGQLSPRCEAAMKRHAEKKPATPTTPSPPTSGPVPGK